MRVESAGWAEGIASRGVSGGVLRCAGELRFAIGQHETKQLDFLCGARAKSCYAAAEVIVEQTIDGSRAEFPISITRENEDQEENNRLEEPELLSENPEQRK